MTSNSLLDEILGLQQDSSTAAVGPHNWDQPPFPGLIPTPQTRQIEEMAQRIIEGEDPGAWHFLIGSPGNGKSALIGQLVRILKASNWEKSPQKEREEALSYRQYYSKPGQSWPSIMIVQDASVSRSPHDPENSLASQLEEVIEEAYIKGLSLFVCANRGVLEQIPDLESIRSRDWFRQINNVCIKGDSPGSKIDIPSRRNSVHDKVIVTCDSIDNYSITDGPDSPVSELVKQLVNDERWHGCDGCSAKILCPFLTNRNLLLQPKWSNRLIEILNELELFRGQSIVFREGCALISMMLAGSSGDYDCTTPCDWVVRMVETENYEALLSRRLYMVLFAGNSVAGFDSDPLIFNQQVEWIRNTVIALEGGAKVWESLLAEPPNAHFGCEDARAGLSELDPLIEAQDDEKLDLISFDSPGLYKTLEDDEEKFGLELAALSTWKLLSTTLQDSSQFVPPEAHSMVHRTSSAFLVRLAGFLGEQGIKMRFSEELEEFKRLIVIVGKPETPEIVREIDGYGDLVNRCIEQISGRSAKRSKLLEALEADNRFLSKVAKTKISQEQKESSRGVGLLFGGSEVSTQLTAKLYCWMRRAETSGHVSLLPEFIPKHLLAGARVARRQAISLSNYLEKEDVELFTQVHQLRGDTTDELKLYRSPTTGKPLLERANND